MQALKAGVSQLKAAQVEVDIDELMDLQDDMMVSSNGRTFVAAHTHRVHHNACAPAVRQEGGREADGPLARCRTLLLYVALP